MRVRTVTCRLLSLLVVLLLASVGALATQEATSLDERVLRLESQQRGNATTGLLAFLFGAFCALWAQNTGRSAWIWFFLGCFFGPLTVVALLLNNYRELSLKRDAPR